MGPIVEIGSYCGRSTLYLAKGARAAGALVIAIDHHRGSEEHQPGEEWHDPSLWDDVAGAVDTLPTFRRTLRKADVDDVVVPVIGAARTVATVLNVTPGMVFIDGGHAMATALSDWRAWGTRLAVGGILAIHDVFPDPMDGGTAAHRHLSYGGCVWVCLTLASVWARWLCCRGLVKRWRR